MGTSTVVNWCEVPATAQSINANTRGVVQATSAPAQANTRPEGRGCSDATAMRASFGTTAYASEGQQNSTTSYHCWRVVPTPTRIRKPRAAHATYAKRRGRDIVRVDTMSPSCLRNARRDRWKCLPPNRHRPSRAPSTWADPPHRHQPLPLALAPLPLALAPGPRCGSCWAYVQISYSGPAAVGLSP